MNTNAIIGPLLLRTLLFTFLSPWAQVFGESVEKEWIDLSYPFNNETIYWPGSKLFNHTVVFANFTEAGFYYSAYDISAAEHGGTHLDAPVHFAQGKWAADQIPLDRLIGPAVKIDISSRAAKNPDAELMVSDLEAWEQEHGKIPDDAILLMFSGWGKYWPNRTSYLGTDTMNTSMLHFPGIHPNASRWLVRNRKIKLVGVDTASLDYGQSKQFESHQIFFGENIPGLENIAHMDKLPPKGATLFAAPMFISGGSGGPCRIFARLENSDKNKCVDSAGIVRNNVPDGAVFLGIGVFLYLFF